MTRPADPNAKLEFRSHYGDDPAAVSEYLRFTREMHGLDLSAWRDRGFWDSNYMPFSFFLSGRIVSNVSIYLLPLVVSGRACLVPQISGVGTEPAFRRRGLNRELTGRALTWCRGRASDFSFLFADEDAFAFYEKCGFRRTPQQRFVTQMDPFSSGGPSRLLNLESADDLALLATLAEGRNAISNELGCTSVNLLMFHALYGLRDCAHWVEELNVVIFARAKSGVLQVFDVVGPRIPPWTELRRYLPSIEAEQVEFMFMPDRLGLTSVRPIAGDDPDGTHIGGRGFPYETQPFRFPYTAHA